ncbi:MAG: putative lipid II flippase FtsW [Candidatus Hydrogenedentes bacterium]|nr:putative lipid II flippase FtsW [Candidatus Hydrogenedentota bacterium]
MKRETTLAITTVLTMACLGLLMVYSASAVGGNPTGLLYRQLAYLALGIAAMIYAARFDYHKLKEPRVCRWIVFAAIVCLFLVLVPGIGVRVQGAQRWIRFFGFGFQPSEFAKFALVLLLAVKLSTQQQYIRQFWRGYLPPLIIAGFFAGLVFMEKDLGVPFVMISVALLMMLVAGVHWIYLAGSGLAGAVLVVFAIIHSPHRVERMMAFWDPWKYSDDESFQLIQSLAAFAQGGLTGRGLGAGEQKLFYLPAAHTDFIFAVIGEEAGLFGSIATVLIFALFLFAGMKIAMNAQDLFGSLLSFGITMLVAFQAAFIMAVTTGMLPTKGLPLPFVSYGGTALIVYLGMIGVLVNIGAHINPKEPKRTLMPGTALGVQF